jgi:WD40 repeat protein
MVAWGAADGIVRLCDVQSGQELARADAYVPHGNWNALTGLAFSPDQRLLSYGSTNGVVRVWEWRSGSIVQLTGHSRQLLAAAFSPDGRRLVTASGGQEHEPTTAPANLGKRARADLNPVIHRMSIIVFDVDTRTALSKTLADGFIDVTISLDTRLFAGTRLDVAPSADWPLTFKSPHIRGVHLQVCQTETGQVVHELPADGLFTQFSPDGKLMLSEFVVWDLTSGRALTEKVPQATGFLSNEQVLISKLVTDTLWPIALVPIRVKLSCLDVRSNRTRYIGEFEPEGGVRRFGNALNVAAQVSPDRRLVVDRQMALWKVPH